MQKFKRIKKQKQNFFMHLYSVLLCIAEHPNILSCVSVCVCVCVCVCVSVYGVSPQPPPVFIKSNKNKNLFYYRIKNLFYLENNLKGK